jgi:cytochrome c oxidase subunit IV
MENVASHSNTQDQGEGQEHPIGIYLKVWILLFVLSFFSYLVDYFDFQGMVRWSLIIIFMLLKAGFIIAVFMHVMWERMALITAILLPPLLLITLIGFMISEGLYVFGARVEYLGQPAAAERNHVEHGDSHEGAYHEASMEGGH